VTQLGAASPGVHVSALRDGDKSPTKTNDEKPPAKSAALSAPLDSQVLKQLTQYPEFSKMIGK
jgi:hypothetical protein